MVEANASPLMLNNGVSADLNDDVWGGTHVPGEQEDLASSLRQPKIGNMFPRA